MMLRSQNGPIDTPTSSNGAGFRAVEAVQYTCRAGQRTEEALPALPDVPEVRGTVVADGDVLRWYIHPVLDAEQTWGAMAVALDLVFDDGSRLSELEPTDQYGILATARGQLEGKALFPDQWNDVQVDLSVAVGRTITDVLVVADPPEAPGELTGWIDGPYVGPLPADPPIDDPVAWVDTRRGTHSSGDFSRGNNIPATAWPNGFCFITPATNARTRRWLYEYHRTNGDQNRPRLQGIGISHQPSPWMGDRNQLMLMPLTGTQPSADPQDRSRAFDHDQEIARPDQYRCVFLDGTAVEVAPTDHGLVLQVDFAADSGGEHLLIEGVDENSRIDAAGAVLDGELRGWVDSSMDSDARLEGSSRMFVLGRVEPAPVAVGSADGATPGGAVLTFPEGTRRATVHLATSFMGIDQARRTFQQELQDRTLEQVRDTAHRAWGERLSVITVPDATPPQRRTLYGNLYRLNLYPNSHHENTGTAEQPRYMHASPVLPRRGEVTATRTDAQIVPGELFVNNGFWDTYRTAWPAYALLYPQLAARLADGFVQHFREGGWIPRWSSPGYADCMTGTSSDISFADLQVKGIALPDPVAAYRSGLRNATVAPPRREVGRKGNERAVFTGYVDTDTDESVSWALEAHINDQGLAAQAELIAADDTVQLSDDERAQLREEAAYLRARSLNYALLFDPAIGFFQGRRADGAFAKSPEQFDPLSWGGDFTETDGWNFAFHVPHDGEGLAALYGGRDGLLAKLEEFFATPERADRKGTYGHVIHEMDEARAVRMGQFGMSNQPSHHIPFLFHHAGAPHRAMEVVREVHRRLFVGEQIGQGYPGDEDNGEMSAWWLLTALGLYPLQLGTPRYHVVAPLFSAAQVRPLGGQPFEVIARDQAPDHPYVTALTVNGGTRDGAWVEHADLHGRVEFTLAAEPSGWGSVPPSLTAAGEHPRPLQDLLPRDASDPLLDDDARTEAQFEQAATVIDLPALTQPQPVRFYTLTSGDAEGGDPIAWRLEGSDDPSGDAGWQVLDERVAQTFPWRRQTRPFAVHAERAYAHHRLVIVTAQGPLRLAQVELLG